MLFVKWNSSHLPTVRLLLYMDKQDRYRRELCRSQIGTVAIYLNVD